MTTTLLSWASSLLVVIMPHMSSFLFMPKRLAKNSSLIIFTARIGVAFLDKIYSMFFLFWQALFFLNFSFILCYYPIKIEF